MSEDSGANARIAIEAVDADTIKGATVLRLSIEGERQTVMDATELLLLYLGIGGGQITNIYDGEGNPLPELLDSITAESSPEDDSV